MRIGLAGFGRMGAAMGARFLEQGHALSVWNRSPGPAAAAAERSGARLVSTPAALADGCDLVLTSLFDEAAVRAVYLEPEGLLSRPLDGLVLIETSTVPPHLAPELAAAAAAAGGRFVDAPVLGTVGPARQGNLVALAGGLAADIEAARPALAVVARAVHAMGPSGAGYAGKLAINLMKGVYWAALGDCLALADRFGIAAPTILDVIESGPASSSEFPGKLPVLRGLVTEPAFEIGGCMKDLRAIVSAGGGAEQVPVAAGALLAVERAVAGGWAGRDVAAVALFGLGRKQKDEA